MARGDQERGRVVVLCSIVIEDGLVCHMVRMDDGHGLKAHDIVGVLIPTIIGQMGMIPGLPCARIIS